MPFVLRDLSDTRIWPDLILSDEPDDWCSLVEQIAELEELLTESSNASDYDAVDVSVELERMLNAKRCRLREIDVAC